MEKEKQEEDMFKRWGASTGTLSRRIIGASASMLNKYEKSLEEGQIDLETSKILFLGDSGVGKTSLQRYFREKGFLKNYNSTRGNEKHHVETAAVTDTWEDVKDPENEQQYAASYAAVKMTDNSSSQAVDHRSSFDQHFKLVFGLLCVCVAFAFFPIGLCSLKIIGCFISTILFSGNLPMGVRYGEGTALSMFYRYACIEILYADCNMRQRMDNPDLLLEFHLSVLCCALVVGFVLGFGCRAGTSLVFSFVCLKSQGSILVFFPVVFDMVYEWSHDFKQTLAVFLIVGLTLISWHVFYGKLYHRKICIKNLCLQVIISNTATALIYPLIKEERYSNVFDSEQVTVVIFIWSGAAVGVFVCKNTSPNLIRRRFYIWLSVYIVAVIFCSYFLCGLILGYMEKKFHHYMIIFLACFSSAMLEYTSMMLIGRSLAKVYDLPFYIRRALGFILGVGMVYLMNWEVVFLPGEFLLDQLLSVVIVIAYEMWGFWQVKQAMEKGIDLTKIRLAKSKYENGNPGMRMKFVLIDCGGQEEYHYFHHLFMPKEAVYIIVFNFGEAKGLKDSNILRVQFNKLRYWLNCVLAHICLPNDEIDKNHRPIFIVGTHRDSVDKEVRQTISQELTHFFEREGIDKYISWNEGTLIFEVENSGQCKRDEQGKHLREQVAKVAVFKKQKTEIKWLKFSKVMPSLSPIITISELKDFVIEKGVVKNENEFENFVKYFNERGDIHCCNSDSSDCQRGFVVLRHGQSWFVDLFLEIQVMMERKEKKKGILSEKTMYQTIYCKIDSLPLKQRKKERKHLKDICGKLLEESHLIVKVPSSEYYLVPFQMENASQEDRDSLWKTSSDKEIRFGLDFEEFEPKPIFWRLTSTLLKISGDINFTEKNFRQTVYSDFAVFKEPTTGIRYKLEMKSISTQNVILFTTRTDPYLPAGAIKQQTYEVFTNLQKQLSYLCKTSFPGQKYSVGLVCQLQDEHTCLWEEKGHVHMYHLGDNKSGFELFDNIPNEIDADCICDAAPKMKIYLHSGKSTKVADTEQSHLDAKLYGGSQSQKTPESMQNQSLMNPLVSHQTQWGLPAPGTLEPLQQQSVINPLVSHQTQVLPAPGFSESSQQQSIISPPAQPPLASIHQGHDENQVFESQPHIEIVEHQQQIQQPRLQHQQQQFAHPEQSPHLTLPQSPQQQPPDSQALCALYQHYGRPNQALPLCEAGFGAAVMKTTEQPIINTNTYYITQNILQQSGDMKLVASEPPAFVQVLQRYLPLEVKANLEGILTKPEVWRAVARELQLRDNCCPTEPVEFVFCHLQRPFQQLMFLLRKVRETVKETVNASEIEELIDEVKKARRREVECENLRKNLYFMANAGLEINKLLDFLYSESIISKSDMEEVNHRQTSSDKCSVLLHKVLDCPLHKEPVGHLRNWFIDKGRYNLAALVAVKPEDVQEIPVQYMRGVLRPDGCQDSHLAVSQSQEDAA